MKDVIIKKEIIDKEAEKLDKLVEEGIKEYKAGKTIKADSIYKALKQNELNCKIAFLSKSVYSLVYEIIYGNSGFA